MNALGQLEDITLEDTRLGPNHTIHGRHKVLKSKGVEQGQQRNGLGPVRVRNTPSCSFLKPLIFFNLFKYLLWQLVFCYYFGLQNEQPGEVRRRGHGESL